MQNPHFLEAIKGKVFFHKMKGDSCQTRRFGDSRLLETGDPALEPRLALWRCRRLGWRTVASPSSSSGKFGAHHFLNKYSLYFYWKPA